MTSSANPDAERAARNEALFRRVNERVEEVSQAFEEILDSADFFCECAEIGCMEKIRMKIAEYERLRAESTHFAVKPGHEDPNTERVVAKHAGYLEVEKTGKAGERADELDPRE